MPTDDTVQGQIPSQTSMATVSELDYQRGFTSSTVARLLNKKTMFMSEDSLPPGYNAVSMDIQNPDVSRQRSGLIFKVRDVQEELISSWTSLNVLIRLPTEAVSPNERSPQPRGCENVKIRQLL
jgi:hypothetical protein